MNFLKESKFMFSIIAMTYCNEQVILKKRGYREKLLKFSFFFIKKLKRVTAKSGVLIKKNYLYTVDPISND